MRKTNLSILHCRVTLYRTHLLPLPSGTRASKLFFLPSSIWKCFGLNSQASGSGGALPASPSGQGCKWNLPFQWLTVLTQGHKCGFSSHPFPILLPFLLSLPISQSDFSKLEQSLLILSSLEKVDKVRLWPWVNDGWNHDKEKKLLDLIQLNI